MTLTKKKKNQWSLFSSLSGTIRDFITVPVAPLFQVQLCAQRPPDEQRLFFLQWEWYTLLDFSLSLPSTSLCPWIRAKGSGILDSATAWCEVWKAKVPTRWPTENSKTRFLHWPTLTCVAPPSHVVHTTDAPPICKTTQAPVFS